MTCTRDGWGLAAVRGRRPMTTGVHVWAVTWETGAGGYTNIGVGTDEAAIDDYIGRSDDSWGWNLGNNNLYHGSSRPVGGYPSNTDPDRYTVPDTFHLVLDMDEGTLSFVDGDEYMGVAFSGLRGRSLYVMAGLYGTGTIVSIKYHGGCM
jgi:SPRY domain-containing SOCS box protein 1/4